MLESQPNFINTEVSFRANQDSAFNSAPQDIQKEGLFSTLLNILLFVTVADKLVAWTLLIDKALEGSHLVEDRLPRLMALLYSRNKNLIYSFALNDPTFAESAIQEGEFVHTNLCGFLGKPFHTVIEFGGRHCQMNVPLPCSFLRHDLEDSVETPMIVGYSYFCTEETANAIHQQQFIANMQAKHFHSMTCFFDG